jgi:hypothetical protein
MDVISRNLNASGSSPPGLAGDSIVREAVLRLGQRDAAGALDILRGVPAERPVVATDGSLADWWGMVMGQALALSGDAEGAIRIFGELQSSFSRLRLGELYETVGDSARARENYEAFLRRYGEADAGGAALLQRGRDGLQRVGG